MKIALIAYEFPPRIGGMETYAFEVAKRLSKHNSVTVICRVQNSSFNYKKIGLTARIVPSLTGIAKIDIESIYDFFKENPPDIIHIMNAGFSIAVRPLKELGLPVIVTANGKDFLHPWIVKHSASLRPGLMNADAIIAVSDFVKARLAQEGIRKKISVINHGTDTRLFKPARKDASLLKKLDVGKNAKIIFTASRIARKKNLLGVIELLTDLPDVIYVIAGPMGDADYFKELQTLAKKIGVEKRVIYAGAIPYELLPRYYSLCDIYVMLSVEHVKGDIESFGIAYLEALSCGKPIIASEISGIAKLIKREHVGFVIHPDNNKKATAAIKYLFDNPAKRAKMGKTGVTLAKRTFNWDVAVKKLIALYAAVKKRKYL